MHASHRMSFDQDRSIGWGWMCSRIILSVPMESCSHIKAMRSGMDPMSV